MNNPNLMENPSYLPSFIIALIIVGILIFKITRIFFREGPFQHIKDDWTYRLPYRIKTMKYKGINRPAYTLICFLYYSAKTIFLFLLSVEIYFLKFLLWDIWKWLFKFEERKWYKELFHIDCPDSDTVNYEKHTKIKTTAEINNRRSKIDSADIPIDNVPQRSSISYTSKINAIWHSNDERMWKAALESYWERLTENQYFIEKRVDAVKAAEIASLSVYEFYDFLYQVYYPWKFTDGRYLSRNRRLLEKHLDENEIEDLSNIQKRLSNLDFNNIKDCLSVAKSLHGLGTAGASGLLAILYPEHFGTVDQFVVYSLQNIDGLPEKVILSEINPNAISLNHGVVLIEIMRKKAQELNSQFNTDFWTPRKIDMVLWSIR